MDRDDMIAEISMRNDVPLEVVEEVLDSEDEIVCEYCRKQKKKHAIIGLSIISIFIAGAITTLYVLDRKEKIDIEATVKKCLSKYMK